MTVTVARSLVDSVPAVVMDVELSRPVPAIPSVHDGRRAGQAWLLVRLFDEPLGLSTLDIPDHGLTAGEVAAFLSRDFGPAVQDRLRAAGTPGPSPLVPAAGVRFDGTPPFLAGRAAVLTGAPPITVVVCTRDRPEGLRRTVASLVAQEYPRARILVVDNASSTDATRQVVAGFPGVEYLAEPVPGLSHARNAAVRVAPPGDVLAWIDDDVVADPHWLAEIARALAEHPDAAVVAGVIVPGELATPAQLWFEQFGGHSKGRGFTPDVFSPATAHEQSPLYPLPPFGTGANMTFRPGVIEGFGGFDPALGAGTPAMGSEDTAAFMRVLHRGGTIVYQPSALVWHYHRPDLAGLEKQLVGYGTGLTAAYTSLVREDPRVLLALLRLAPTAVRDLFSGSSQRVAGLAEDFPVELLGRNRQGMLRGPLAYARGRRANRRGQGRRWP